MNAVFKPHLQNCRSKSHGNQCDSGIIKIDILGRIGWFGVVLDGEMHNSHIFLDKWMAETLNDF